MAAALGLPNFQKFDVYSDENSVGIRWNKYISKLENLFTGMAIDAKKRKKALLLHYAGDEVFEIYETLNMGDNDSNYDTTKTALGNYFNPKKNKEFERYEFRNIKQGQNETIDQFATRLRQKAENCDFTDKDGEIKSQIIQGCYSHRLRTKCLEDDKELTNLLTMARTMEIANKQANSMTKDRTNDNSSMDNSVDKIRFKNSGNMPSRRQTYKPPRRSTPPSNVKPQQKCRNCGGNFPHATKCPALGLECHYCHKKNHLISVCRKKQRNSKSQQRLREIAESGDESESDTEFKKSEDEEISFGLETDKVSHIISKVPSMTLTINDVPSKVLIDTGSTLNIVSETIVDKMCPKPQFKKSKVRAFAFGQNKPLPIKGKYTCIVETDSKFTTADFHVVSGNKETIISYQTAVQLQIIPTICALSENEYEVMCNKYPQVFHGLGKLKNREIKFHID